MKPFHLFTSLRSGSRARLFLLLSFFLVLAGVALVVYTAPIRDELWLSKASFDQLRQRAKRDTNNSRVFYHLGVRLREEGHDGPALAAFARAADLAPDDLDTWLAWASTAGSFENDRAAFSILTVFLKAHPKDARAHLALAFLYRQESAEVRAFEEASKAAELNPNLVEAWRLIGAMGLNLRRYVEAETALRQAVKRDKDNWRSCLALGDVLNAQHKEGDALFFYQKAATLSPNNPGTNLALGQALLHSAHTAQEVSTARDILEKSAKLAPDFWQTQAAYGYALVREKKWEEARGFLTNAEKVNPQEPSIHFALIDVYRHLNDRERTAREEMLHRETLTVKMESLRLASDVWQHPTSVPTRLKYARFLSGHGEIQEAVNSYERLLAVSPRNEEAKREHDILLKQNPELMRRTVDLPMPVEISVHSTPDDRLLHDADAMLAKNRFSEADRTYRTLIARDDKNASAYEGLGIALLGEGNSDEAFRVLNYALKLNPSLTKAGYSVAHLYFDAGFPNEAAARMRLVLKREPNNAEYWHSLGLALTAGGSVTLTQQAVQAFAHASRLTPKNAIYLRDLANTEVIADRFADAETHYRQAVALEPKDPISLQLLGSFLVEHNPNTERVKEAESLLKASLAIHPDNPSAQLSYGSLLLKQHDARGAIPYLEKSILAEPNVEVAWYRLHRAYSLLGNSQRADYCLATFKKMTKFNSDLIRAEEQARIHLKDPARRLKLARLMVQGKEYAKGINQYQMCLKLDPKNEAARKELEILTKELKAKGQLPSMETFQGMMIASTAQQTPKGSNP